MHRTLARTRMAALGYGGFFFGFFFLPRRTRARRLATMLADAMRWSRQVLVPGWRPEESRATQRWPPALATENPFADDRTVSRAAVRLVAVIRRAEPLPELAAVGSRVPAWTAIAQPGPAAARSRALSAYNGVLSAPTPQRAEKGYSGKSATDAKNKN